jgi:phenol hydroxylase P1 protein
VADNERTQKLALDRFGDKPASRYQVGTFNVQPTENFHYRPTWDPAHNLYDADFRR